MPSIKGYFYCTKHELSEFGRRRWEGIKTPLTLSMPQHPPHFLILNKKEESVKLHKDIIIKGKSMNKNKILLCGGNMQNIV
jgi:hypothetical protein